MNVHAKTRSRFVPAALALTVAVAGGATLAMLPVAAAAQIPPYAQPYDGSGYGYHYDSVEHLLRGTVASFSPYRVLLARDDRETTEVDLKKGTVIEPVGTSITPGMHLAVHGYWSKGVFIADRVTLR
jgi:hypothetical protein